MKKIINILFLLVAFQLPLFSNNSGNIIHVAKTGDDSNDGSQKSPLLTINAASKVAMPGDLILVHEGTYREWVKPERGGIAVDKRITYRSAPGENVSIKGSERITNWTKVSPGVWMVELPDTFFGGYNPYRLTVSGGWLEYGKWHHLGDVYLNGEGFLEMESINEVLAGKNRWHCRADETRTIIHANFGDSDPNSELAEINVRESVFMPDIAGLQYITVDGFHIMHAATNWTPPSIQLQMGAIGPRLGKNWIIENCEVSYARSVGIVIGTAPGVDYTDIDAYGNHLIQNNIIRRCGQAGIAGQRGATRSTIDGNLIEETNYRREFGGYETAGIKFHHSVDVVISNNLIRGVYNKFTYSAFGLWIDAGNQGFRISRNIVYDTDNYCVHLEINHGPMLLDNNIFIGDTYGIKAEGASFAQHRGGIKTSTDGVVYTNNLFVDANQVYIEFPTRITAFFKPHTQIVAGREAGLNREDKWFNNIFIRRGLDQTPVLRYVPILQEKEVYKIMVEDLTGFPGMQSDHNLFLEGAKSSSFGDNHSVVDPYKTGFKIEEHPTGVSIYFSVNNSFTLLKGPIVDAALTGIVSTTGQTIEDKDGNAISVNRDFYGKPFKKFPLGPLSNLSEGLNVISWDIKQMK